MTARRKCLCLIKAIAQDSQQQVRYLVKVIVIVIVIPDDGLFPLAALFLYLPMPCLLQLATAAFVRCSFMSFDLSPIKD